VQLHVVSDRCISERIREIPADVTQSGEPITFQIWDVTRLKRIQDGRNVRDDLVVRNVSTTLRQPAFEFKLGFPAFGLAG
jgi:hypothetical protein